MIIRYLDPWGEGELVRIHVRSKGVPRLEAPMVAR